MAERLAQIHAFLERAGWRGAQVESLAGDASSRRYFRVRSKDGLRAVLMDAPLDKDQNITSFLLVANQLSQLGLSAPRILESDFGNGFVLMQDFGDALFVHVIENSPELETRLYLAAVDVLVTLDTAPLPEIETTFTHQMMRDQAAPAYDWYAACLSDSGDKIAFLDELETVLANLASNDETSTLLRDFHAENLVWLPDREGIKQVGLLDFQDAMQGPAGYDLVSLLLDARRDVSPETRKAALDAFVSATGRDADQFAAQFATLGVQRNLRILGIFARLCVADGKPRYIDFIPRVWAYVEECLTHPALSNLARIVHRDLPEPTPENLDRLREKCATIPIP